MKQTDPKLKIVITNIVKNIRGDISNINQVKKSLKKHMQMLGMNTIIVEIEKPIDEILKRRWT